MSSYTKGPWRSTGGYNPAVVAADGKTAIASRICSQPDGIGGMQIGEIQANARLISAAPEMYEALKALRRYFIEDTNIDLAPPEVKALLEQANAALAKAEGGQ